MDKVVESGAVQPTPRTAGAGWPKDCHIEHLRRLQDEDRCDWLFASRASAAASFRSTCGSERGAPECSMQRSPAATPHVGQGTDDKLFGREFFHFHSDRTGQNLIPSTWCQPQSLRGARVRTSIRRDPPARIGLHTTVYSGELLQRSSWLLMPPGAGDLPYSLL